MQRHVLDTPVGQAWIDLDDPGRRARNTVLVIGHGAGGSVDSPDIVAIRDACVASGIIVARVTQPYRVAGRSAPPAAVRLDAAWSAVIAELGRRRRLRAREFVFAGRSSGARVACRTASDPNVVPTAARVVTVAFPVHPPGKPEKSRLVELDSVRVPVLVVQGSSDPFGMPPPAPGRTVCEVPGDHSLKASATEVGALVARWLSA
jgi:predicted alpha/beta-hydrolase family hydrolase